MIVAVVYHPGKTRIQRVRQVIETLAQQRGWRTLWFPTQPHDLGLAAAHTAVRAGAQLVFAAGGDGIARTVCGALVGTGVSVALLPAGTGNLLARNLGVPMTLYRAAHRGFTGTAAPLDLLRYHSDVGSGYAAIIAGLGADAAVVHDTGPLLKRLAGPAAYVISGARHINPSPIRTWVRIDDEPPQRYFASLIQACNVGDLHRGIKLIPQADATDGLLDIHISSPLSAWSVLHLAAAVILRTTTGRRMLRRQAHRFEVTFDSPQPFQVDGDVLGRSTQVTFEVVPAAVHVVR